MSDNKILYVAKDNAGGITAICDNPVTVENLRALIDDNVVTVPITGKAVEDYVFAIDTEAGSRHFATSEAEVVDYITSMPELDFKKDSQFYGLPKDEAREAIQAWLDDGHMANELTEDLNNTVISEYMINTIYSQASPLLNGLDIDNVYKEMFGRNYHETAPKEMIQEVNESGFQLGEIYYDNPTYWTEAQKDNRKIRVILDSSEVDERLGAYTSPEENLKDVAKIFTDYIQEHISDINSLPHITEANLATKYLYKNLYEGSGDMFFVENYDTPWEELNISKEEFIRQVDEDVERFNLQNVIEKQSYDCLYTCYSDLSIRFSLDPKGKEVDLNNEIELNQQNSELRRSVDNWNSAFIELDKNPALTTRDIAKQIKGDITKGDIIDLVTLYKKRHHQAKIYQVLDMTNHRATAQLLSNGKFNEVYRTHSITQELLKTDRENQRTKTGLSR